MERIDDACQKVLDLKEKLGLFEDPFRGASPEKVAQVCLTEENRAIALRAAEQSAVLLKNDGILPLSKDTKKIALIGPCAEEKKIHGGWSCYGRASDTVSVKEGITRLLPDAEIVVIANCDIKDEIITALESAASKYSATFVKLSGVDKVNGHPTKKGMTDIKEQIKSRL